MERIDKKFCRQLADADKTIKQLNGDNSEQRKELKQVTDSNVKLKLEITDLSGEIDKLRLSAKAQNLQDSSFVLNRSIDHGEQKFAHSLKKQEYSQFLKSTQVNQPSSNSKSGVNCT